MRNSGLITLTFQQSEIHKKLLQDDPEHLLLAYHLMVSVNSHMSGLYYYPVAFMASEIMRTEDDIERSLAYLESLNFLQYDFEKNYIWVINMANEQGGFSSKKDSRRINCLKHIRSLPRLQICENFIEYYRVHDEIPNSNDNGGGMGELRGLNVPPTVYIPSNPSRSTLKEEAHKTLTSEIENDFPRINNA